MSFTTDPATGVFLPVVGALGFASNGAEWMRIDSAGSVAVGTSIMTEKFNVRQGNVYVLRTGGSKLRLADQFNEVSFESVPVGSSSEAIFKTSTLERMRIDATGNVGISTATPFDYLTIGSPAGGHGIAWGGGTTDNYTNIFAPYSSGGLVMAVGLMANTSSDAYASSTSFAAARNAIRMNLAGTVGIQFFTGAVSTTARGTAITPTERMQIDTSGNVGIGMTPIAGGGKLQVIDQISILSTSFMIGYSLASQTSAVSGATTPYYGIGLGSFTGLGGTGLAVNGYSGLILNTAAAERMRIDGSGNVGIGTTTNALNQKLVLYSGGAAASYFQVANGNTGLGVTSGFQVGVDATGNAVLSSASFPLITSVAGVERLRIDTLGNVGIGASSTPSRLVVKESVAKTSASANVAYFGTASADATDFQLRIERSAAGTGGYYSLQSVEQSVGYRDLVLQPTGGNLGIGNTAVPTIGGTGPILDLYSASTQPAITFHNSTSGNTTVRGGMIRLLNANFGLTNVETTGTIDFNVNGGALRIDQFGNWIPTVPTTPPTLTTNGQLVMNLTSNTNLRISVRGTDGTTRVANITVA
jgi:hypothetical protein